MSSQPHAARKTINAGAGSNVPARRRRQAMHDGPCRCMKKAALPPSCKEQVHTLVERLNPVVSWPHVVARPPRKAHRTASARPRCWRNSTQQRGCAKQPLPAATTGQRPHPSKGRLGSARRGGARRPVPVRAQCQACPVIRRAARGLAPGECSFGIARLRAVMHALLNEGCALPLPRRWRRSAEI